MRQVLTDRKQRHDPGYRQTHGVQVPLLSSGETHRGYFEAPKSAVTFKPHTNRVHSYSKELLAKVKTWVAWKEKQGWLIQGKPRVLAPIPKPFGYGEEAEEDTVRVYVEARFYRTRPLYVSLDDFLHRLDQYQRYELSQPTEALTENPLPQPAEELVADDRRDPLKVTEARRQELGLRREFVVKDGVVTGAEVVPGSLPDRETD